MALNKEQILGSNDIEPTEVEVPEWGGSIFVKQLTGAERDAWELFVGKNPDKTRASLAAFAIADEAGKPLFTLADIDALGKKSGKALDRIFTVTIKHNKLSKDEIDALEKK